MNSDELLIEYLQEIVLDITERIGAKDLSKERQVELLLSEIGELMDRFGVTVTELVPQIILETYFGSVDIATNLLIAQGVNIAPVAALTAAGTIAPVMQKKIHVDAVSVLITDTLDDLQAAIRTAKNSSLSSITETLAAVKKDLTTGTATGAARKKIQAKVMETFRERGFDSFEAKNGTMIPLDSYAMTVVRTKMRDAAVTGSVNRYVDSGNDLVQIIENSDTCPVCSRFRGMVVSLTGATEGYPVVGRDGVSLPPYHPNCRGTIRPYVIRFKTADEINEAKKRNKLYAKDTDVRTAAQKAKYKEEQKARARANAEKKQFMRYQMILGAEAPKTLGAFRTMKRSNSIKFQELQSMYLSATNSANKGE